MPTKSWEQIRERNESLDAFVLALAALRIVAPTPARFIQAAVRATPTLAPAMVTPEPEGVPSPPEPPAPEHGKPRWVPRRQGRWIRGR